jgi:hypothetical protein
MSKVFGLGIPGVKRWFNMLKQFRQALFILRKGTSVDNEVDPQAYVDLLKASWILTDILQDHPQRTFLHKGSQQLELMALSNVHSSFPLTLLELLILILL